MVVTCAPVIQSSLSVPLSFRSPFIKVGGARDSSPDMTEPVIMMGPSNTTAMMGDIVVFTCDTLGDPPPQISWQRNGRNIYINGHSSYKILDSGSLQLDSVGPADYGMYHCLAKNDKGVASSETAHLQVEAKSTEKIHRHRLAILVSSLQDGSAKLLGVPKLLSGSGKAAADAV
ncbi:hypothetical protein AVEN_228241-1 [Araneus ventricosus]|uniref:Ig-like domain-containing protein n=1 Tax=Araneus ventricosus TaxID=182803 RepID=A0A4Y2G9J7_ARAVE|nr:hypothetical protein AVEN_228241-1 [Araneus ventricosus]